MPGMPLGLARLSFARATVRFVLVAGEPGGKANRLMRIARKRGDPVVVARAGAGSNAAHTNILVQELTACMAALRSRTEMQSGPRPTWMDTVLESRLLARRKPCIDSIEAIRKEPGTPSTIPSFS
jgi:hypothetical protein